MADFLGKAVGGGGSDGIARVVGQQAGKAVEGAVKKAMGGNKQHAGEQKKEGGGGGGGGGGGFDVGDVLKLAGGNKNEGQGGGLEKTLGGLFN